MDKKPTSFELAATETLRRIRRDLESAPPRLKPILSYIESHLYEAGLDFQQLRIACKIRDNTVPIEFHSVIGMPPYTYIKHCRLETAARLLRDTELKVWQICMLVGYSGIQVFSRAFLEWSGMRPTAYRKKKQFEAAGEGGLPIGASTRSSPPTSAFLRRAVEGKLNSDEAERLIQQLQRLYPDSAPSLGEQDSPGTSTLRELTATGRLEPVPDDLLLATSTIERIRAEEIWRAIAPLPDAEQRTQLRSTVRLSSTALFELVRKASLFQGRDNRQNGVALAELALFSVGLLDTEASGVDRDALKVRAWSWLGNAHRLALNFIEAEKAFLKAEHYLPELESRQDYVIPEYLALKATLRWYQKRDDSALRLIERALELGRRLQLQNLLVRMLVMKSAILQNSNQIQAGLQCLYEARQMVDSLDSLELRFSVHHAAAFLMTLDGDYAQAAEMLPALHEMNRKVKVRAMALKLTWMEGLIAQGLERLAEAEEFLRQARDGFIGLDFPELTATVTLDLALLFARQGRSNEVTWLVTEIIPIFDALQHRDTALVALKLLQNALDNRNVTLMALEQSRENLIRLQWEPGLAT